MTSPHPAGEDGSTLIEVIAGIGMLALLTVSLLTFHLGWLNAEERTQVRIAALDLGSA
jgi:type II secretory pathway pseudopilin PulG